MRWLIRLGVLVLAAVGVKTLYERYARQPAPAGSAGASSVVDTAKGAAREVADHAKSALGEVAEHAKSAAGEVAADARARAEEVKQTARDRTTDGTEGVTSGMDPNAN